MIICFVHRLKNMLGYYYLLFYYYSHNRRLTDLHASEAAFDVLNNTAIPTEDGIDLDG